MKLKYEFCVEKQYETKNPLKIRSDVTGVLFLNGQQKGAIISMQCEFLNKNLKKEFLFFYNKTERVLWRYKIEMQ